MLEALKTMDTVSLRFSQDGLLVLNLTLAFIMFGVALGIKTEHFTRLLRDPRSVIVGYISQFFLLPAITFVVVVMLRNVITPTVAMGMILVASCPGGNISNFMSSLAKGNAALSVSLTALATLSAIFMTPLNFAFWGGLFLEVYQHSGAELLQPLKIDPIEMFKTVFILLGIPLVLGMLFAHYLPKITKAIIKPLKIISILAFFAMVVILFKSNYDFFLQFIKYIFLIVLLHNLVALSTGFSFASITRRSPFDRRAITIETGIQNSGLGLVLLFNPNIFPPEMMIGGMAVVTAWWGVWHILSGLTLAGIWSRIPLKESLKR
ncbi:MAG: bile acid:sodium symporter family protein [Bacteroidia bacterium]|nr:MAG: bile acid:sodium symporter family protein [Bacteroidia bacterium]